MNATNTSAPIVIVLLIGIIGWLRSAYLHHSCNPYASYAIRLPALICYFLGSFRKEHIVHFGGVIMQIIIYVGASLLILYSLGKVSTDQIKIGFGIAVSTILLLEIWYIFTHGSGRR